MERQRALRRAPSQHGIIQKQHLIGPELAAKFQHSRQAEQVKQQRSRSPYTISMPMQVKLCIDRGFQRLQGDLSFFLSGVTGKAVKTCFRLNFAIPCGALTRQRVVHALSLHIFNY